MASNLPITLDVAQQARETLRPTAGIGGAADRVAHCLELVLAAMLDSIIVELKQEEARPPPGRRA